ncbi:MAG: TIGR01777 family oxidoreductase [Proteobacteria bacterium]|nr:TIGR01777 family oxidoreductase [Pseudomonadota bacterium]
MNHRTLFTHSSTYSCSAAELHAWHSRPGALERLLPPWEKTMVLAKSGGIEAGGQVLLKMHLGPFPFHYQGRHLENIPGKMFRDIQEKGPFAHWSHSHFFKDTPEGAELRDVVEYSLRGHAILPGSIRNYVTKNLKRMFYYREAVLREDILLHKRCSARPMRLLVSGASGALGRDLLPLLTTGGHQVFTLVRRPPDPTRGEIFWDPEKNILNEGDLPELDGVIHLAGEYIGLSRWSEDKKRRVIDSRVNGTELLARTLAAGRRPPEVFLSASATGYYGDCGEEEIDEAGPVGAGFMSEVCRRWEQATEPARQAGIRTVQLRLGVGLTQRGGALKRILASSPCGYIRRFGTGKQYISWISSDDMISAMLHALTCPSLSGPLNIAAPEPVTNQQFMRTLARISRRPLLFPLPAWLLQMIYGQMASEILLSSCRVTTKKLIDSGFCFRHPNLEAALTALLGKDLETPTDMKRIQRP